MLPMSHTDLRTVTEALTEATEVICQSYVMDELDKKVSKIN